VTLQFFLSKMCFIYFTYDPCKENHWLPLFRKVQFLIFDTVSLWEIWI